MLVHLKAWLLGRNVRNEKRHHGDRKIDADRLFQLGEPGVTQLIKALVSVRDTEVAEYLVGEMPAGNPRVIDPLIRVLLSKEKHTLVRRRAARRLGGECDPRSADALAFAAMDEDSLVRIAAAESLGRLGKLGMPGLLAALTHKDEYVRAPAAEALGAIDDARAAAALLKATHDSSQQVRHNATQALGGQRQTSAKVFPTLVELRESDDEQVRYAAVVALGQLGDTRAFDMLVADLASDRPHCAIKALGNLRDPRAVAPLIEMLGHTYNDDQTAATEAIGKIGRAAVPELLDALERRESRRVDGAVVMHRRIGAIEALAGLRSEEAVGPLIAVLQDKEDSLRVEAARALGEIGWRVVGDRATQALSRAAVHPNIDIRGAALRALNRLGFR